ncbi:gamma-tubulin complex component 3-like [Bidens hawaiensis]|uniref:gamma-tubulin complex component 3-like n=1 Tax=Bidens hawaiensis TaxID=980011 RepID=UPI00404904D9
MESDHHVGDLVRQLLHHLQPNTNPNPEDVNYAIRILSSRMTPSILADEPTIANSIKTRLAKQDKLSDALTFTDLYSRFASKSGPGSVINKQAVLYLLKIISDDRITNPKLPSIGPEISDGFSSNRLKNGGILNIVRNPNDMNNVAFGGFARLVLEENDVSENELVTDVLSVCQGIDGRYVKFDDIVDSYVLSESIKVQRGSRIMVHKLCELGWLFRKVDRYVTGNIVENVGLVVKSFCVALQDELVEYHKLLRVLRSQSVNPIPLLGLRSETETVSSKGYLSLRRLAVWLVEPTVKMRRMAVIVDSCKNLKGGEIAGAIHLHAQHGDRLSHDLMKRLLFKVSSPVYEMVRRWVIEGDLQDLHSEFFISELSVERDYLWRDGYRINYRMLPSFIPKSLANRVLRTGKSINFLKVCCSDHSTADLANHSETNALESLVAEAEKRIDKHLMHTIFTRYKFKDHCLAIKRYILLGQGDFVQYLMEIVGPVLSEPAKTISKIHLSGLLEKAILSSGAQYDDRDVLDRLKVKMMPHRGNDTGWDVFRLDYAVQVPLNTVFTESTMSSYLKIFSFLWKIRRVEYSILGAWKTMKPNVIGSHVFTKFPKAVGSQIILTSRKCHVIWDEMNNFVMNLQSYIMFEVLEVTWSTFCDEMEAVKDLDDLIAAHEKYLVTIIEKSLLGENSENLYKNLLKLFDVISHFTSIADRLYEFRTRYFETKKTKTFKSKGLETDPWLKDGRKAVTQRANEFLNIVGQDLDAVSKEYSSVLKGFITQLPKHVDLKFLMFRLDFTEFYRLAT